MASTVAATIKKALPKGPPSLSKRTGSLYEVLSSHPKNGVGQRVHQIRWGTKGIEDSYWVVTKTQLKLEGTHGKAWGKLYWRGKPVSDHAEQIRGGLKYSWRFGVSQAPPNPKPPTSP
ncbi:hypothetical protein BDW22DRAFT_1351172 [Trametopsis cervina]|nr:hypothetical protein BDW22DRAFT_1351172 [Trametopsis cervina]